MARQSLPEYIDLGGQIVHPQPIKGLGMRLSGFLFQSSPALRQPGQPPLLQQLCNQALNSHSDRHYDYHVLGSHFILTFSDTARLSSSDEIGYVSELCTCFWLLTLAVARGPIPVPKYLALYVPYIFVDNQYSAIGAREVYGFRKSLGEFGMPGDFSNPDHFTTSTLAFKAFSPETKAEPQQLVELRRVDRADQNGPRHKWDDHREFFPHLVKTMLGHEAQAVLNGVSKAVNVLELEPKVSVPVTFVKQFRDIELNQQACYQAIVEAHSRLLSLPKVGLLRGEYHLSVSHADSHPIDIDLGVPSEGLTAQLAFWSEFDMLVETGKVIQSWPSLDDNRGWLPLGIGRWLSSRRR